MSQFLNEAESFDAGDDELKQSLRSLKPRSSIDPKSLMAELASRTDGDLALVPPSSLTGYQGRRASAWWPTLTALSWLVTAGVWWSSMSDISTEEPSKGITTAASDNGAMTDGAANDPASAGQLGESIAAGERAVPDDATINASDRSDTRQTPPLWLAWLGLEFAAFDPQAGERRWEQMQEQSESTHWPAASGTYSGDHVSATYASLRSEFDNPIRRNWFAH